MRKMILLAMLASGCGFGARIGRDPMVDIVRAMAEAQTANVRAIMEAFNKAQAQACAVPEVAR